MGRGDSGKHSGGAANLPQLAVAHRVKLCAGVDSILSLSDNSDLPGNRTGGRYMVPGNHYRSDSRGSAGCHRRGRFLPRGIVESRKSEEGQALLDRIGGGPPLPQCKAKHPQRPFREPAVLRENPAAVLGGKRNRSLRGHHPGAARQQQLGSALDIDAVGSVGATPPDRHSLSVGIKRNLPGTGEIREAHPRRVRRLKERGLGRLSQKTALLPSQQSDAPALRLGVVAVGGRLQQTADAWPQGLGKGGGKFPFGGQNRFDGHFILRKGPGFVRADDGGTAQRFNGVQPLDQGVAAQNPAHGQRQ